MTSTKIGKLQLFQEKATQQMLFFVLTFNLCLYHTYSKCLHCCLEGAKQPYLYPPKCFRKSVCHTSVTPSNTQSTQHQPLQQQNNIIGPALVLVACRFINQRLRLKPCKSRGLLISLFCVLSLPKRHTFYWSEHIHLRQIVCLENIFKKCILVFPLLKCRCHCRMELAP